MSQQAQPFVMAGQRVVLRRQWSSGRIRGRAGTATYPGNYCHTLGVTARSVHRHPPTMSKACSGDVPGDGLARGAVTSRTPSNATGLMSALCSTGRFRAIADQTSAASSRSTANRSAIASASRRCRASCVSAAASSASLLRLSQAAVRASVARTSRCSEQNLAADCRADQSNAVVAPSGSRRLHVQR